jgi:hypothetical protein
MQTEEQPAPARRSLRSIVDELLERIDAAEGEVTDEVEALEMSVEQKVDAYAAVIKQWAGETQVLEDMAKAYKERAAKRDAQAARLKERLAAQLDRLGAASIKAKTVTASFRETQSVDIADETAFVGAYHGTPLVRVKESPDKAAIKAILDSGVALSYASIKTNRSLQLR